MVRKWLLLCLCLEFHHKAWRCRHETDDGLKILYRKIKKGHSLWQENGMTASRFCIAKLKKAILFGKKMVSACVLFH